MQLSAEAQAFEQAKAQRNLWAASVRHAGTIRLQHGPGGWYADWSSTDRAAEIEDLFGSTTLITAWGPSAYASEVLEGMQRLNRDYRVVVV